MPSRPPRHNRRWTRAEAAFVLNHLGVWSVAALARHLGRTPRAVQRWCERQRAALGVPVPAAGGRSAARE